MKSLIKVIGIIAAVAVVVVVVAAVAIPLLVDPNDYKEQITARVKEETGRELKIVGDINLSVFPWLAVETGRIELGNAPGFEAPVFAGTEKIAIRVKLMPLFSRRLEMDTVTVHGLTLNLERDAKGQTNWGDLAKGGAKQERHEGGEAGQLAALAVGGLDIRDANLSWRDAQAGQAFKVQNLSIQTGALALGKALDLKLGFDLDSSKPKMSGRLDGGGKLFFDPDAQLVKVTGLDLLAKLAGDQLPGGKADVRLAADAVFDGKKQSMNVDGLRLTAMDLDITGELSASELYSGGKYAGKINIAQFSPRNLIKALGQPDIETADAGTLAKASLQAELNGTQKRLVLKPLSIKLDDSSLNGDVSVDNFAKPAVRFQLALDQIDADRYLPPQKQGEATAAASPGAAASTAGQLPLETLRSLDVNGKFTAGKVKIAKLTVSDVLATLTAKDGVIRLHPVSAKLYEGAYTGDIRLDARKNQPRLSVNEKLAGVQAGPLLKDLQGKEQLTGKGDVTVKVSAAGAEPESIKKTLNGNAAFIFRDGALKGVNVGKMIRETRAKLQGKTLPPSNEPEQTDFAELSGTLKFTNGLATNKDLMAQSPLLRITGAGQADLPTEKIDYTLSTKVVATSQGQGGKGLQDLSGMTIPIKVSGTFQQPQYGLDAAALGAALAESKATGLVEGALGGAGAGTEEGTGSAGGDIIEKTKGLLKGLFGN